VDGGERRKMTKKGREGRRGEEDGGHTSSPKSTHEKAAKHHWGCGRKQLRVLEKASLRREATIYLFIYYYFFFY
jgi:hypothetical protein